MKNITSQYQFGFSAYAFIAFILQELPYLPWLLWPPIDNPLANNIAKIPLFGILEKAGGTMTVVLLIVVIRKDSARTKIKEQFFIVAVILLFAYYICWIYYFSGITNGWLIVIGLSAVVPLYYLSISLWMQNYFALISSLLFLIGHTGSNIINYLL